MYSLGKIRKLAGPFWLEAITTADYKELHPRCRGGDGSFRYLAWHGDALLDVVVVEHLLKENGFTSNNTQALGQLTKRKSRFVSRKALAWVAKQLGIRGVIRAADESCLGHSYCAETIEATIAAVYKHSGEKAMQGFVYDNIITPIAEARSTGRNVEHEITVTPQPIAQAKEVGWGFVNRSLKGLPRSIRQEVSAIASDTDAHPDSYERLDLVKKVLVREHFLAASS